MKKCLIAILIVVISCCFISCKTNEEPLNSESAEQNNESNMDNSDASKDGDSEEEQQSDSASESDAKKAEDFDSELLINGVSDYVELLDVTKLDSLSNMQFKIERGYEYDAYTVEELDFYISRGEISIRLPKLKGDSAVVKEFNDSVLSLINDYDFGGCVFATFNYEAYIYEDVLSIRVMLEDMYYGSEGSDSRTVISYNFDISSGELQKISNEDMFVRLGVNKETVKNFMSEYASTTMMKYYVESEDVLSLDERISECEQAFEADYANDKLIIYKDKKNKYYNLESSYPFYSIDGYTFRHTISLFPSEFGMALLSKPEIAGGMIYNGNGSEQFPDQDYYGRSLNIVNLNEKVEGRIPVYIFNYLNTNHFLDISDVELLDIDLGSGNKIFVNKLTSKDVREERSDGSSTLYIYYTNLPETMPFEEISMSGKVVMDEEDSFDVFMQDVISDDMRFGNKVEYMYMFDNFVLGDYVYNSEEQKEKDDYDIRFKVNGEFEVGSDMASLGFPFKSGRYEISLENYVVLFPSKVDVEAGANECYVLGKTEFVDLTPIYPQKMDDIVFSRVN